MTAERDDLLRLLAAARPCAGLSDDEVRRVASLGNVREAAVGENLIVEDDASHEMFVVLEGTAGVFKADPANTRELKLGEIARGDAIGELSMLRTERRLATVRAETPCRLFVLDRPAFDALIAEGDPAGYKMALQLARIVSGRMIFMHEKLMEYLCKGEVRQHEFASFKQDMMRNWDF